MLNGQDLGQLLYSAEQAFNEQQVVDIEAARLNHWKAIAETLVNYFTQNTEVAVQVTTTGTAAAQSGTGNGTIS